MVYAKPPFAGPEAVLAYLSRYTHRVAISNRRLLAFDETGVTFRYKDYRRDGDERYRTMTLQVDEFIRRFLLHVLPKRVPPHSALRPARQFGPQGPMSHAPANCSPLCRRPMTTCQKSRPTPVRRAHAAVAI